MSANLTPAAKLAATKPLRRTALKPTPARKTVWVCRVREVREQHRLSLDDVAGAIGLSKQALWQLEHGTDVVLTTAVKLATFFGLRVEQLWTPLETRP